MRHDQQENRLPSERTGRLAVGGYLDAWLRDSVAGTVSRHTQRGY